VRLKDSGGAKSEEFGVAVVGRRYNTSRPRAPRGPFRFESIPATDVTILARSRRSVRAGRDRSGEYVSRRADSAAESRRPFLSEASRRRQSAPLAPPELKRTKGSSKRHGGKDARRRDRAGAKADVDDDFAKIVAPGRPFSSP
jgi:hypothetical protein